ncbi:MAG: TolC family protein [Bacillota bacterium]
MADRRQLTVIILAAAVVIINFSFSVCAQNELDINEAVRLGLENNRQLQNSWRDVLQAEKELDLRGKEYMPTADLQGSYTKMEESDGGTSYPAGFEFLADVFSQPDENYSTSISLNQPLYLGGRVRLAKEMAVYGVELSRSNFEKKAEDMIFNIVQGYYGVLQADGMTAIRENALEVVNEHLRIVEVNYEVGTALRQDLLQTRIEKRKAEEELTSAQNQLQIAKKRLAQLLGQIDDEFILIKPKKIPNKELDKEPLLEAALNNRSEINSLRLNKLLVDKQKKLEGNPYRPSLSLNGSYSWQGEELDMSEGSWSISIRGTIPLYDGGKSSVKEEKQDLELEKIDASRLDLIDSIKVDIEEAVLAVQEAEEMIELERLSLENAEENLELANKSYRAGIGTNIDVINAQTRYRQAQTSLLQAEYKYEIDLFRVLHKTGRISEYFEDVI